MPHRVLKMDTSISGVLKAAPYGITSIVFWLTDMGVNIKFLSVFLLLWLIDIVSGVIKSIVVSGEEKPTSKTGIRRVASKFVMLLFPVVTAAIYSLFTDDAVKMLNWGLMILALHEGYSVLGNFYSIRTGKMLTEFDAVSYSIKLVADWIRKKVDRLVYVMEGGMRDDDWKESKRRKDRGQERGDGYGGYGGYADEDFTQNGDYNLPKDENGPVDGEDNEIPPG